MGRPDTAQARWAGSGSGSGGGQDGQTPGTVPPPDGGSGGPAIQVMVVLAAAGREAYRMYEALSVTQEGATLRGGLLLEVNEEVALELRLADRTAVQTSARVVEIALSPPVMKVVWTGLADDDRHRLG